MFLDVCLFDCALFFFFKKQTAYELRISDWSSDVCSSDLPFASLVLAQNSADGWRYAGRVGTGFGADVLEDLGKKMAPLAQNTAALDVPREMRRGVHWVKPELVAEIAFAEFTAEGVVRHASFIGLRGDKSAKEVVPERPVSTPEDNAPTSAVKITNPDRIIFPGSNIPKGQNRKASGRER